MIKLIGLLGMKNANLRIKADYPFQQEVDDLLKKLYFEDEDIFMKYQYSKFST